MIQSSETLSPSNPEKQPWVAVILSRIIPGIGQIYAGHLVRGLVILGLWLGCQATALWLLLLPNVKIVIPILFVLTTFGISIWNLFDAHTLVKKSNTPQFETLRKAKKDPWLAVFLSLFIPGLGHFYIKKIGKGVIFFIAFVIIAVLAPLYNQLKILVIILRFFAAFKVYQSMNPQSALFKGKIPLFLGLFAIIPVVFSSTRLYIQRVIMESRYIPSGAMLPTLQIKDRLIIDKISYKFNPPERGDIIVFSPTEPLRRQNFKEPFIKRIIGLPGETVEVSNGQVKVNNQPLEENYITEPPAYEYGPVTVPQNSYLVLGDNRNNSYDSHYWGFVPKENIIGKANKIFWPQDRARAIQ